jgi:hypothetical protein
MSTRVVNSVIIKYDIPHPDSDDLSNIIDIPAPIDTIDITSLPSPSGYTDTDGMRIIYAMDTSPGKFHKNIRDLNIMGDTWGSNEFFEHDCSDGNTAAKITENSLVYWRMNAKTGTSSLTGDTTYVIRPTWISDKQTTPPGLALAKARGYLANVHDPKNIEMTAIIRVGAIKNRHQEATMKWRGSTHSDDEEKTLQGGSRFPYNVGPRPQLFTFEKTHPDERLANATFVSPYTTINYPRLSSGRWRGIKTVVYNINHNQGIHVEWWIDENPVEIVEGQLSGRFNNNWQKIAVYEEQGSETPTWGGPQNMLQIYMADMLDMAAFSLHEIVPPSDTSSIRSAEELADVAEYEANTGMTHPQWIQQISEVPIASDPNTFVPIEQRSPEPLGLGLVAPEITSNESLESDDVEQESDIQAEIKSPNFISVINAVTGSDMDATRKFIKIKKIAVPKIPKPIVIIRDECDEAAGAISITPAPVPGPDETTEPFDEDHFDDTHFDTGHFD